MATPEPYLAVMNFSDKETEKNIAEENYKGVPITPQTISYKLINLAIPGKRSIPLVIEERSGCLCGFRTGEGTWLCFEDTPLSKGNSQAEIKLYEDPGNRRWRSVGGEIISEKCIS